MVELEPISIGAQFIYISRLPTLLNHVQARVALPVGKVSGMAKCSASGTGILTLSPPLLPAMFIIGQPPSTEWITLKVLLAVGSRS